MHCDLPNLIPVCFGRPIFFLLALADLFLKYCCVYDVKHGMKVVVCTVTCQIILLLITLLFISCCFDFISLYN